MDKPLRRQLFRGFWATSLGTLASRVLGLARDVATASLLGLGEGGVMDAFVVAFRLPNLPRKLFGEGALAASLLPVFAQELERDRRAAWRLLSLLLVVVAAGLTVCVVLGEVICLGLWWLGGAEGDAAHVLGLSAVMLPYLVVICLAAQVSAALQGLFEFRVPAVAPLLLNICWLATAWFIAPQLAETRIGQAYVIAAAVVVSGCLQLAIQLPALMRLGFRFEIDRQAWPGVRSIGRSLLPVTMGLAVTQLNTFADSLIAWGLAAEPGGRQTIAWLGDAVSYPLQSGAAAAIYYGERFYQLPVGLLGVAIATVVYPLLGRHAARGDRQQVGADLTLGLRLVWFTALPAGVGIVLLAQPITRVLFERGSFTSDDAHRAATMIACYATGVWAYCALPLLVRGYYAVGQRSTPARVGMAVVGLNLLLNLTLIWPLAERGLALATSLAAAVQVAVLVLLLGKAGVPLDWPGLKLGVMKGTLATGLMAACVLSAVEYYPAEELSRFFQTLRLGTIIALGIAVYASVSWILRMEELSMLLPPLRTAGSESAESQPIEV